MWQQDWRERLWASLPEEEWDIVIVGGGITGAGILREASRVGLKVLMVEQGDFSSGTSSRSSKLVHGGLRYLKTGQWRLTLESVRERERLMQESGGLVTLQGFITAVITGTKPGWWVMKLGLWLYDLMARKRRFKSLSPSQLSMLAPRIREQGLRGGFWYPDAQTDDARLTLRVIQEAQADGGQAVNYAQATELLFKDGAVCGLMVKDRIQGDEHRVNARLVINAAGAWCDRLRMQVGGQTRIRPLRGSHLVFDYADLPCAQAVSFFHKKDGRPVFAVPWEGSVILGTTDLDHEADLDIEPRCSLQEAEYLLDAINYMFPQRKLGLEHVIASYAGVRPVIGSGGNVNPSDESREHALWVEKGLLSITGGKLTTFRTTALQVLEAASSLLPELKRLDNNARILAEVKPLPHSGLGYQAVKRLYGRYGQCASQMLSDATADELKPVLHTPFLWLELRWAARHEAVMHLQDLMLRRTRLGFVLPDGGMGLMEKIRAHCQSALGWDDRQWELEVNHYQRQWESYYAPPGRQEVSHG